MHTRVSQAIDTAVESGTELVVAIPELGLGAIGTVRRQGQEFLGLSRITVEHRGLAPSETYLRRLRDPDRQKVVYAAAAPVVVMPRSWKRVCMLMRRVS